MDTAGWVFVGTLIACVGSFYGSFWLWKNRNTQRGSDWSDLLAIVGFISLLVAVGAFGAWLF